ncbi:MAG: mandelate racemase/muconate lactonizing enzyme family protein [Chloroflexota bacterium]
MKITGLDMAIIEGQTAVFTLKTASGHSGQGEANIANPEAASDALRDCLLGANPSKPRQIGQLLNEHGIEPAVKAAIDIACWNIQADAVGLPLAHLLGGTINGDIPSAPVCHTVDEVEHFQASTVPILFLPMSGELAADRDLLLAAGAKLWPGQRLIVAVGGKWGAEAASGLETAVRPYKITFLQPCATYEACRAFQQHVRKPIIWDAEMLNHAQRFQAYREGVLDHIHLDIQAVGSLTTAVALRDLCVQLYIPMLFGSPEIGKLGLQAARALARSTPERFRTAVITPTWPAAYAP